MFKRWLCKNLIKENEMLRSHNELLRSDLLAKGNIFFAEKRWLGYGDMITGSVVDGKLIYLDTSKVRDASKYDSKA